LDKYVDCSQKKISPKATMDPTLDDDFGGAAADLSEGNIHLKDLREEVLDLVHGD
jgi:hypothetical protein